MYRFFEFSDGNNILIESNSFKEAIDIIKKDWWSNIFEKCDFKVTTVNNSSLKKNNNEEYECTDCHMKVKEQSIAEVVDKEYKTCICKNCNDFANYIR